MPTEHLDPAQRRTPTLVSVIMPVRNGGDYLSEQLAALARQSYSGPWELVACDDGSTDDSRTLLEQAAERHDWAATIVAGAGEGPGPARNRAIRASSGDLLCLCDADDLVDDEWLSALVDAAGDHDMVAGRLDRNSLNPAVIRQSRSGLRRPVGPVFAASCNLAIWRDSFDDLGAFDPLLRVGEDTELSIRAHLRGLRVGYTCDAVVAYRYRSGLRDLFWQQRRSGRYGRLLRRRYGDRASGLFPPRAHPLRMALWLAPRVPYLVTARRRLWIARLGVMFGDIEGRLASVPPPRPYGACQPVGSPPD